MNRVPLCGGLSDFASCARFVSYYRLISWAGALAFGVGRDHDWSGNHQWALVMGQCGRLLMLVSPVAWTEAVQIEAFLLAFGCGQWERRRIQQVLLRLSV